MCSPLAVMAVGTVISAAGQYQQGQTQQAIDNRNAMVANYQASDALVRGSSAEQIQQSKVRQLVASQTAAAGASGAAVESQSFGKVIDQTNEMGTVDALTLRTNALREAWGYKNQAAGLGYAGDAAALMGTTGAIGTALTGFGSAYNTSSTGSGKKGK